MSHKPQGIVKSPEYDLFIESFGQHHPNTIMDCVWNNQGKLQELVRLSLSGLQVRSVDAKVRDISSETLKRLSHLSKDHFTVGRYKKIMSNLRTYYQKILH